MSREVRCHCSSNRLLAIAGLEDGKAFLHIKSHRAGRVLAEVIIDEGSVRLRCNSCDRWHKITVRGATVDRDRIQDSGQIVATRPAME